MDSYKKYIAKLITNNYHVPKNLDVSSLFIPGSDYDVYLNMKNFLSGKKKKSSQDRVEFKVDTMVSVINQYFNSKIRLLDVGAGDGEITIAMKQELDADAYIIDPKGKPNIHYHLFHNWNQIPGNSFNLVLLLNVLHHVPDNIKNEILGNILRVTVPGAMFIVKEHDYQGNDPDFILFLQVVHSFWYVKNNETVDQLYLFNKETLHNILTDHGFTLIHRIEPAGYQRLYTSFYLKE